MRKKVFIGFLAALMLFAFTACDNGTNPINVIRSVSAEADDTVYLPGETVDPSKFTYTVLYYDGRVDTATADDIDWVNLVVDAETTTGDTYSIGGYYAGNQELPVVVEVNFAVPSSITVDSTDVAEKDYYLDVADASEAPAASHEIDKTGLKITAKFTNPVTKKVETREIDPSNKFVSATISDWDANGADNVTVTYAKKTAPYTQTLKANLIVSVAMKISEGYKVYINPFKAAAGSLAYATETKKDGEIKLADGDTAGVYMEATYSNGQKQVVAPTDILFKDNSGEYTVKGTGTAATDFANYRQETVGELEFAAAYNGKLLAESMNANKVAAAVKVPFVNDSIVALKAVNNDKVVEIETYAINGVDQTEFAKDTATNTSPFKVSSPATADVYPVYESEGEDPNYEAKTDLTTDRDKLAFNSSTGACYKMTAPTDLNFASDVYSNNQVITVTLAGNDSAARSFSFDYQLVVSK